MNGIVVEATSDTASTDTDTVDYEKGCAHYKRKCVFIAPCCSKEYVCRVCHDEMETHEIDRHKVQEIRCSMCNTKQKVRRECIECSAVFGAYYCVFCRLYDDNDRGQFHCNQCGICRVGGRDNFFHCEKCDMCLGVTLQDNHRCVEAVSRRNCPVCLEDLHTSREQSHICPCGHLLHRKCFTDMLKNGKYACPLCNRTMLDMEESWRWLDEEIAHVQMPEEYRDKVVFVLCRDCHQTSEVKFHVIGQKCGHCGSYNTCNTDPPADWTDLFEGGPSPSEPELSPDVQGDVEADTELDTMDLNFD